MCHDKIRAVILYIYHHKQCLNMSGFVNKMHAISEISIMKDCCKLRFQQMKFSKRINTFFISSLFT